MMQMDEYHQETGSEVSIFNDHFVEDISLPDENYDRIQLPDLGML